MECKNCTERFLGCHGTCESYIEYRQARDAMLHERYINSKEKQKIKRVRSKNILSTHMR